MKESQDIISLRLTLYCNFPQNKTKNQKTKKTPNINKMTEQDKMAKFTVLMFSEKMSISLSVCTQGILCVNLNAATLLVIIYIL